ncbi:hypothetical protein ACKLNR_014642 [Fusarium oxysporum f. sp. zingiberi]
MLPKGAKGDPLWNPVSRLLHQARKLHAEHRAQRTNLEHSARLPETVPQFGNIEGLVQSSPGPVAVGWNKVSPGTSDDLILDTVDSEQWDAMMGFMTAFAF